jgi:hypothetical protein
MDSRFIDSLSKYCGVDMSCQQNEEKPEKKPSEFKQDKKINKNAIIDMRAFEKNTEAQTLNENKIICDNIITYFFGLENDKFIACINKINEWGFYECMKSFIMNYYLVVKKNNKLRQYIINHLDSIINMLKDHLELNLMKSLKNFDFSNFADDAEIKFLQQDLANRRELLKNANVKGFEQYAPPPADERRKLTKQEKETLRDQIRNKLMMAHPELEEDL